MAYLVTILFSYLLGCANLALGLARLKRVDLRAHGSKNPGASNAMILLGWKAGVLVALHDIGKAALAVVLACVIFPQTPNIGVVAGVAAVLGHIFPAPMRFRGGKGFASYLGMTLALNWRFALVVLGVVIVVTLLTDYIVAGTTATVLLVPSYMGWQLHSVWPALILLIATGVILCKHRENYRRMLAGTEFRFRSALQKKSK